MKYKIKKLMLDKDGNVDMPDGCIPLKYNVLFTPSSSDKGQSIEAKRILLVLEPVKEEKK